MTDEFNWIDDCFRVEKGKFLWHSYLKDGTPVISSLTEQLCASATQSYLKQKQEGFSDQFKSYDGVVDGKL